MQLYVPLPEIALIDHSHILWPELITSLYGTAHPLYIIDRCIDINVDDNEKLVLAARDEGIPSGFFRYPNRNLVNLLISYTSILANYDRGQT